MLSFKQCFILFSSFPLLLAFVVGGLGFEFCVFVAGWKHALGVSGLLLLVVVVAYRIPYTIYVTCVVLVYHTHN